MFSTTKYLIALALFAASASASSICSLGIREASFVQNTADSTRGIVNFTRCGGYGTPIQLRISDCKERCAFIPGQEYGIEYDFITSTAQTSLSLVVEVVYQSWPHRLFDVVLPDSSVNPGKMYTVRCSIVPDDTLAGNAVLLRAITYHTEGRQLEGQTLRAPSRLKDYRNKEEPKNKGDQRGTWFSPPSRLPHLGGKKFEGGMTARMCQHIMGAFLSPLGLALVR
ncbi:uncharacterized protein LOC118435584 [Folsomia candida]|uniref:uncharacterized protein LOC118435584 n=1 Tax=Folsomia candida TaxID=158441 RepID=UPI0016053A12|nr:uncharacterized protein LOC118435584 [Folsomia candida]